MMHLAICSTPETMHLGLKHDIQLRDESQKAVPPQTIDGSLTDSDKNYLKSIRGCGRPVRESGHGVLA